jgi:hypothetical protein
MRKSEHAQRHDIEQTLKWLRDSLRAAQRSHIQGLWLLPLLLLLAPLKSRGLTQQLDYATLSGDYSLLAKAVLVVLVVYGLEYAIFSWLLPRFAVYFSRILPAIAASLFECGPLSGTPPAWWMISYGMGVQAPRDTVGSSRLLQRYAESCYAHKLAPVVPLYNCWANALGLGAAAVAIVYVIVPVLADIINPAGQGSAPAGARSVLDTPSMLLGLEVTLLLAIAAVVIRAAQQCSLYSTLLDDRRLKLFVRYHILQLPEQPEQHLG